MKIYGKYRVFVISTVLLFFGVSFIPLSMSHTVNENYGLSILADEGQILFTPMQSTTTYLIDSNGFLNHTWQDTKTPGEPVYMLEDGTILRTIKLSFSGGGAGGGVRKITWDGTKIWILHTTRVII